MSNQMSITLLHDPQSSASGKFYIGIEDSRFPATMHGPKTKSANGTLSQLKSSKAVGTKLREKRRKNYIPADISDIPAPAIDNLRNKIAAAFNCDPNDISIGTGKINLFGGAANAQPSGNVAKKPRRRKSPAKINVWI